MSMVEKIADCLVADHVELMNENQRLIRENSILRQELKIRIFNECVENYEMTEEEAERSSEQLVTYLVVHNEGEV